MLSSYNYPLENRCRHRSLMNNLKSKKLNIFFYCLPFYVFLLATLSNLNVNAQTCNEFNSGSSQSALNIALDKDKFFELTYSDIARTKRDDFTISFTPAVKKTLRDASKNSGQILSLIIKYDKSEPGRPPMLPFIRFFVPGTLGATNLKAESSSSDDCKEVHNFNISVPEAKQLFQNSRLDFDLLINVLSQGPANRIGQKFRITLCLNCPSTSETPPGETPPGETPPSGGGELPLPELAPLSSEEEAIEGLKKAELLLDKTSEGVSGDALLADKVKDITDNIINVLSKLHGSIGIDSNSVQLGTNAKSSLDALLIEISNLKTTFTTKGISITLQNNLDSAKSLIQQALDKLQKENPEGNN